MEGMWYVLIEREREGKRDGWEDGGDVDILYGVEGGLDVMVWGKGEFYKGYFRLWWRRRRGNRVVVGEEERGDGRRFACSSCVWDTGCSRFGGEKE